MTEAIERLKGEIEGLVILKLQPGQPRSFESRIREGSYENEKELFRALTDDRDPFTDAETALLVPPRQIGMLHEAQRTWMESFRDLRLGRVRTLLALGAQRPDLQKRYSIWAFGSPMLIKGKNMDAIAGLRYVHGQRRVVLMPFKEGQQHPPIVQEDDLFLATIR